MSSLQLQDQHARSLALDVKQSFIVQAPAGSGKTELLIQRYLSLLNTVQQPEEILAITFTKKAANEMRSRVIRALQSAMLAEPEAQHAKKTWQIANAVLLRDKQFNWQIINNPNQLRIQTIDSFCSYLTKQLPLLSQFGAQPTISHYAAPLYNEAVDALLKHIEKCDAWSDSIANLLMHLDNDLNKLHQLLVGLLAKRDQWLPYISLHSSDLAIKAYLESHLENVIVDHLQKVWQLLPQAMIAELLTLVRYAASNTTAMSNTELYACRDVQHLPGADAKMLTQWRGITSLLLTKSGEWRKRFDINCGFPPPANFKNAQEKNVHQSFKTRMNELIQRLMQHEALQEMLSGVALLPDARYDDNAWHILQSLLHVLKIAVAELRLVFQQRGEIDFIENAQAALAALGCEENPTDLSLALDYQIKHILIDEFQDTSFSQLQLLQRLTMGWEATDGRTLFIVGDPMQSIYRFREAEVGIYIRMFEKGFGHINIKPLKLYVNFRAQAVIVKWNNTHFDKIFPHFSDIATGAVPYSHSVVNQEDDSEHTAISIQGFQGASDAQAKHLITYIHASLHSYPQDSIAILVRSRSHLAEIMPYLKQANIAYHAVEIDLLAHHQFIQDLLSLTCALLHPYDRIAWLALLRAPWCGLTLTDLWQLTAAHPNTAILSLLQNDNLLQTMNADAQVRLQKIKSVCLFSLKNRGRLSLRAWVENAWLMLGGPACLNDQTDLEDVKTFFALLDEMGEQAVHFSLSALKQRIAQLYASKEAEHAQVQIMTIHAAKGLEFDTVIIPHIERKMPADDKPLLTWMEQPLTNAQTALLISPIHAIGADKDRTYEYIVQRQKLKAYYETDRLFYVATTRAKKRLCILFDISFNEDGKECIDTGSFLEKLWPLVKNQQATLHEETSTSDTHTVAVSTIKRLALNWQNPIKNVETPYYLHQKHAGFLLPNHTAQITGTILHCVLQSMAQHGVSWWQQQSAQAQCLYLQQQLNHHGLAPSACQMQISKLLNMINNVLIDPRGQWIFSSHSHAQSEYQLTMQIDGNHIERIIIDRTFIDEDNVRWIIDYKTTSFDETELNEFLNMQYETYIATMTKYAQAIQAFTQTDNPIKLGLYFPAIPAWKEWDML